MSDVLVLDNDEVVPSLSSAVHVLELSLGFVQDFGKIQLIKENNESFDVTFDTLSSAIKLSDNYELVNDTKHL